MIASVAQWMAQGFSSISAIAALPVFHLNFAEHQNHVTAKKAIIVNNFYCNERASAFSAAVKVKLVMHCSLP